MQRGEGVTLDVVDSSLAAESLLHLRLHKLNCMMNYTVSTHNSMSFVYFRILHNFANFAQKP